MRWKWKCVQSLHKPAYNMPVFLFCFPHSTWIGIYSKSCEKAQRILIYSQLPLSVSIRENAAGIIPAS